MSEEFTEFVNLCYSAASGTTSFDVVCRWLLNHKRNKDLLLSEGTIDFLLKLKAPVRALRALLSVAPSNLALAEFSDGRTTLHLAACSSVSVEVMEYLLEENITAINRRDFRGNLPVHCAVNHFAPYEVITFLMSHRSIQRDFTCMVNHCDQTLVHIACSSNPRAIEKIGGRFLDVEPLKMKDVKGNLPLHIACSNFLIAQNGSQVLSVLLRPYREALQIPNNDGNLPLHLACAANQGKRTIQQLLKAEYCDMAFPDAAKVKNKYGKLPLHVACEKNAKIFTIESLLYCYPEAASVRDNDGNLPIHLYCRHNHSRLCLEKLEMLLVNYPYSLSVINKDRYLPSCYFDVTSEEELFSGAKKAIIKGYSVYLVQLLVMEIIDTKMIWKDSEANSLLHYACMKSGAEVSIATIAYLLDRLPLSCNSVNKDGKTPKDLLKAAASYKDEAGRLLLHRLLAISNIPCLSDDTESLVNFVADAYPNSVTVHDNDDMLPFHLACLSRWCFTNEVFALLRRYPDSLNFTPNVVSVLPESKRKKLS